MIPAILIHKEPSDRRREERRRVRLDARWLDSGPLGQSLTIRNLSTSGFLLETDQTLSADSSLIVEMPGGVVKVCKTVWTRGKLHGAKFSELLSETELQDLVSLNSVVWPSFGGGAHTTSSVEPVDLLSEIIGQPRHDRVAELQFAIRVRIIIGIIMALWALISTCLWLGFG